MGEILGQVDTKHAKDCQDIKHTLLSLVVFKIYTIVHSLLHTLFLLNTYAILQRYKSFGVSV